jgi:hypothetical protein
MEKQLDATFDRDRSKNTYYSKLDLLVYLSCLQCSPFILQLRYSL